MNQIYMWEVKKHDTEMKTALNRVLNAAEERICKFKYRSIEIT
jgi:hypothetical protein